MIRNSCFKQSLHPALCGQAFPHWFFFFKYKTTKDTKPYNILHSILFTGFIQPFYWSLDHRILLLQGCQMAYNYIADEDYLGWCYTHSQGGFACAAGTDTSAGHSWDRNTALMLRSSCACALWHSCKWTHVCGAVAIIAIIGFPHGYLRALSIICLCAL